MDLQGQWDKFVDGKGWSRKVLDADVLWGAVKEFLAVAGIATLPQTPRKPDVRLIVDNISGKTLQFLNPGDHSGSTQENIPGEGEKTSTMIMLKGDTLAEQYANAAALYNKYDLANQGFSEQFLAALQSGALSSMIAEAYGPAPFKSQADKLVEISWREAAGQAESVIMAEKGAHAAYGTRAIEKETVFLAMFDVQVKGTSTTAELVESDGICIAVSVDYKSKAETTRPIAPSVARGFYGEHYDSIPKVVMNPDGVIRGILIGSQFISPYKEEATSRFKGTAQVLAFKA